MSTIKFKGNNINTQGNFPKIGENAPNFKLINIDLTEITLNNFKGKKILFNIFPSVDTGVCALQLKTFNAKIAQLENTVLLFASIDLPFAFKRFCGTENINNAITASDFRYNTLADNYGIKMTNGPLEGLYARAVIIIDENQKVIYSELVDEVTDEPDYTTALKKLQV